DTLLPDQLALKTVVEKLRPLFEDPGVLKVGHAIKDDLDVLQQHGIRIAPVDDTMLLSFVLDGGKHGHGLDDLAERYLDQKTVKFTDVAGSGAKQVSFDKVPIERAREYAAGSADVTSQLWMKLKPRLAGER